MHKIIFLFFMMLCGCSSSNEEFLSQQDFSPNTFQFEDLALYDRENKVKIMFGMKRSEVEALLGEPIDENELIHTFEYPGIEVHYKDDKVNGLLIRDNTSENERFITPRGIKFGDQIEKVLSAYGNGLQEESPDNISLTYILEKMEKGFVMHDSLRNVDPANSYTISMNLLEKKQIVYFMIADYEFTMDPTGE